MMDTVIDAGLALLLTMVLIGGFVMSRRLAAFRDSREDLGKLIISLTGAVDKAYDAIAELKAASDLAEDELAGRLAEVKRLSEEVQLMQQSGESLARRLEDASAAPRRVARAELRRFAEDYAPQSTIASSMQETPAKKRLTGLARQIAALDAARQAAVHGHADSAREAGRGVR